MQFEISPSVLSPILATMSKLIGSKTAMPILENVKFYEQSGHYLLTATSGDQETVLTAELPLENVQGFHPFLAPISELSQMVKAAEGSIFPLTFKTGTHNGGKPTDLQLCIDYGEGEYQLMYADITEYPVVSTGESNGSITFPMTAVAQMSQAAFFTATDNFRPVMLCVLLDAQADGNMNVVASDSKTLFLSHVTGIQSSAPLQTLLTSRTISLLSQMAPKGSTIQMHRSEKFVTFDVLSNPSNSQTPQTPQTLCRIESRLTEGRFPPYQKIIPNNPNSILIECQKFKKAVERASVCANSSTNQLRFDLVPGQSFVTVKAQDVDFSRNARTTLEVKDGCQNVSSATAIGLRADYLTRCINAIGTKDLTFTFTSAERACLLNSTDQQTTVLIMPQKLTDF